MVSGQELQGIVKVVVEAAEAVPSLTFDGGGAGGRTNPKPPFASCFDVNFSSKLSKAGKRWS